MQIAGPSSNIDLLTWMQQANDAFIGPTAPVLVPMATAWGASFACLRLIKTFLDGLSHALLQRPELIAVDVTFCCARIAFTGFIVSHWATPIPVINLTVPDAITLPGREIAGVLSMVSVDQVLDQVNRIWFALEHPPLWNLGGLVIYYGVLGFMSLLDGALFLVMFFGFFAIGLGKVFGSLIAVFYLLPGWESKFHSMINFLWTYGMYRATAAAYALVVTTFLVRLFNYVFGAGDYTLGHVSAMAVVLLVGVVSSVVLAIRVPHINAEIWGGGHAGNELGSSLRNLAVLIARGA
jgi:hypothetical protein